MEEVKIRLIFDRLKTMYPNLVCELNYENNYQLLVAVILSAQCTDKRVNMVTKELFKVAPTPESMIQLGEDRLKEIIRSCGFYNAKARNIMLATKALIEKHNSEVPSTRKELVALNGVGEKTASVVLAVAFRVPAIAVDTHVFRLSSRIGFCNEKTPNDTMRRLQEIIPKELWIDYHYALVLHGRYLCKAQNPKCEMCKLKDLCKYAKERNYV